MSLTRRNFLKTLGGVALGALPPNARPDHAGAGATSPQADWCGVGDQGQPLFVPGERGFLGRLVLGEETLTLRAVALKPGDDAPAGFSQAYVASFRGRDYVNPTLVLRAGQRVRVELVNAFGEATIERRIVGDHNGGGTRKVFDLLRRDYLPCDHVSGNSGKLG